MVEQSPEPDYPKAARIVGMIYLTFCAAVGGGVPLYWHPQSIYLRAALAFAVAVGLILAIVVPIKDPTRRPIRWGLLWLALGFLVGPGPLFVLAYFVN
jgi:hypothetical protein